MAPPKTKKPPLLSDEELANANNEDIDFSAELIKQINKEAGNRIAFNLGTDDAPTNIKRWISTGSKQLDYIVSNRPNGGLAEGRIIEIQGPASCHAKGTLVLKYDGNPIKVEEVTTKTVLMGPDSKPRKVLEVHSGKDEMYRITPFTGANPFTVNQNHILTLKRAATKKKLEKRNGEVVNVTVKEYVNSSRSFKKNYKLYRSSIIEFNKDKKSTLDIPPYILGLLIGDGSLSKQRIELTTADNPIVSEFTSYVLDLGHSVGIHNKAKTKAIGLYVNKNGLSHNILQQKLESIGLLGKKSGDKFIPKNYQTSSKENRLELLAGLIDTDGYRDVNGSYEYTTKSLQLSEDVAFVARSLGFSVTISDKFVADELYYRLYMFNNKIEIPSRLSRKQQKVRNIKKNLSLVGFNIEAVGVDEYYGFAVDSDNLFLGYDFLVHHNSGKSHIAYEIAKSTQHMGGIVVYIDTENATSVENLETIGIDIRKKFVFIQETCIEEIFKVIESTIEKARNLKADVPVTIIWDSVAASAPKAEIEGDYDQNTIGLAARVLSKGFRKITHVIGDKNVCLLLLNQQRVKIGCVSPETMIQYRFDQAKSGTMRQLFKDVGLNFETMEVNQPIPVDGWEVRTLDKDGSPAWRKVLHAVRKPSAPHMRVITFSGFTLDCSPDHKLFVESKQTKTQTYQEVVALADSSEAFQVLTEKGWETFNIQHLPGVIEIADIEVEGEHSYLSNGILSHNTLYGDPSCVSPDTKIKIRSRIR